MSMSTRWWVARCSSPRQVRLRPKVAIGRRTAGNDWNQRYSRLKTISDRQRIAADPPMISRPGLPSWLVRRNTPIVSNGVIVRHHPVQYGDSLRPHHQEGALAYASTSWHHHLLRGPTIAACHSRRRPCVHGNAGCPPGRARRQRRQVVWDKEVADPAFGYASPTLPHSSATVIVGVSGGVIRHPGSVTAYNARAGDQVWRWYSIPGRKATAPSTTGPNGWWGTWAPRRQTAPTCYRDVTKEKGDSAKYRRTPGTRGGGGVWMTPGIRQGEQHHLLRGLATPPRPSTGSVGPATTSTPTAWWPSTRARARRSGTTRRSRTTSGPRRGLASGP